jgi:hypothetical protein
MIRLAYAWTGSTEASDRNGLVYDFRAATEQSLPWAARLGGAGFHSFVSEFRHRLSNTLPQCMINLPREELTRGIFVGYFQGQPFTVQIKVLYPATVLMVHPVVQIPVGFYKIVFSGAESVYPPYADTNPQTSAEAIDFVQKYLQDCVNSSNPDCVGIGGHIHIAEVTPREIRWVIPPISS